MRKVPQPYDRGLPSTIDTELGEAHVSIVRDINAHKSYLCPLCDTDIEQGTEHALMVPAVIARLRRHAHTECLKNFVDQGISIKLHPKEPDVIHYYFGTPSTTKERRGP